MPGRSPLQPSTIGRPALEQRLDAALVERRLTCVVAGPGFGKTTLLSHWAETTPHAMSAWHGMTPGDRTLSAPRAGGDRRALRLCVPALPADLVTAVAGPARPRHGHRRVGPGPGVRGADLRGRGRGEARGRSSSSSTTSSCSTGATESAAFLAALCRQAAPPLHVMRGVAGRRPVPGRPAAGPGAARRAVGRRPGLHGGRDRGGARRRPRPGGRRRGRRRDARRRAARHDRRVAGGRPPDRRGAGPGRTRRPPPRPRTACADRAASSTTTSPTRWWRASPS